MVSVIFYVVGTIVEATSDGVSQFCGGAVLYQIGYTMIILLVEVIVADLTSTRARLFFSFVPALPFVVCPRLNRAEFTLTPLCRSTRGYQATSLKLLVCLLQSRISY